MPFTLAHPAAVLPLRRSRFLQTVPLIIGSLVPDVPYFFTAHLSQMFPDTHTLYGSISVCVPLGMALLVFTLLLREPLTILLGPKLRWLCLRSLDRFLERPLRWPIALLSILIGSWTHIAWDSFTHPSGWTTLHVPALSAPVSLFGWETETSHLLQYLSSAFGLAVLAVWVYLMLVRVPPLTGDPARPRARWVVLAAIGTVSLSIGVARSLWAYHLGMYYRMGFLLLTRSIGWFVVLYLAAGLIASLSRRLELEPAQ